MEILLLATRPGAAAEDRALPALDLLRYSLRVGTYDVQALLSGADPDVVLVDARRDLLDARDLCRLLRTTGLRVPLLAVVEEAGLIAMAADWGLDDVLLTGAGPAEVEARLRLAAARVSGGAAGATSGLVNAGELVIDPHTYSARLKGRQLDLTYKEFELLKFLAQHPGRVFSRDQLLREVWGFDYFGGHRTVDVHVRRLRAKLGSEYESMIGTVRQVGYKLVLAPRPTDLMPATEWEVVAPRVALEL
ncbi:winged-helix domain-containing protein [Amorphoplanes digitatis]|uniref:DNA-binding response OmpR family regulator n=1 Tax=Actinoplanes digitatis TaxID=1868 RepID=A0A7W7I2K7_9ACTN|nr:response regulator transcription factor [Actinoplanes digitatis]MBB4765296.1 DNA-binding response OmpR family regulator [Actinoplanes digitatis]